MVAITPFFGLMVAISAIFGMKATIRWLGCAGTCEHFGVQVGRLRQGI